MGVLDRFRLDGRTAVVTGGSRGLGRAMAQALAEAGADLVLVGRDPAALETVRSELAALGHFVAVVPGDVSTPAGAEAACRDVLGLNRPIDVLVNNVGGRRVDVATEDVPLAQWRELIDLNLTSALVCCQQLCRGMLERGRGAVVNVTSIAGPIAIKGIRGRHYETAKAALTALTKSLAADWAPRGVRVNAIAPGVFLTAPNRKWFGEKPTFQNEFVSHIPMGRMGEPEELGPAAVFLASDASSYVTGATVVVDGGYTLW
ncbi:SDR family NAD(P)-dependent oxidoreductase [Gemmata sp. JC717]|uniref:SDR family NAD(P)-dependent oxidoreductase n=1 Tax=Gemmata algarum TaxID=2975278 RepID=UPI0021BB4234|nr:SDR family NAD(P)-dependent oxidoreductase [Gemmata algarum]MDY3556497.1 SDR family NAD(P)-dependent oxidoreductase [Gemmata algarum]